VLCAQELSKLSLSFTCCSYHTNNTHNYVLAAVASASSATLENTLRNFGKHASGMFLLPRYILETEPGLVTHLHEGGYVIISDDGNKNVLFGNDKRIYEKYI